ncbi:hypothetical protein ACI65C_007411 [Semiaphis heraclei]
MSSTTKDKKDKQLPDKRSMTILPKLSNNSTNDKWIETKKRNLSSSNSDTTLSPKVQHKKNCSLHRTDLNYSVQLKHLTKILPSMNLSPPLLKTNTKRVL